jgi:hypothetical protein
MATVQIQDIYNPLTFGRRAQERQVALNRFLASGVVFRDERIAAQIAQGGNIGEVTYFNPLSTGEPNYSTDNPATLSTPANIASKKERFRTAPRNKSWSTMDLARELALQDPLGAITGRVGAYWATDDERRIIQSALGIMADNKANDAGDMVVNIATDDAGAVTDDERISADSVITTMQTLGDHKDSLAVIAMHSAVHTRLMRQNLIDYVPPSGSNIGFETYLGKRIIVDDSLPAVAGANRITYTCILFGGSVIGTADGQVLHPSATERVEAAGNGGGQDIIYSRVNNVFHFNGFDFTSASVAGQSATYAELATAANWDRKVSRKNVPMAFLQVND